MKCVIKRADGAVSILSLVDGTDFDVEVEKWKATASGYISHRAMPDDAIPTDRYFRNAWGDTSPELVIDIDMVKARDIHRNVLRRIRAPLLDALDDQYFKADEAGNAALKQQIAAKKQALRDVPADPRIDAAATPEELKAIIPTVLVS